MSTQPSQLNPFYAYQTVGLFGTATAEMVQPWGAWKAQAEPFPSLAPILSLFPARRNDELVAYVREMAGTSADLDSVLETAAVEHLLRENQAEGQ